MPDHLIMLVYFRSTGHLLYYPTPIKKLSAPVGHLLHHLLLNINYNFWHGQKKQNLILLDQHPYNYKMIWQEWTWEKESNREVLSYNIITLKNMLKTVRYHTHQAPYIYFLFCSVQETTNKTKKTENIKFKNWNESIPPPSKWTTCNNSQQLLYKQQQKLMKEEKIRIIDERKSSCNRKWLLNHI